MNVASRKVNSRVSWLHEVGLCVIRTVCTPRLVKVPYISLPSWGSPDVTACLRIFPSESFV